MLLQPPPIPSNGLDPEVVARHGIESGSHNNNIQLPHPSIARLYTRLDEPLYRGRFCVDQVYVGAVVGGVVPVAAEGPFGVEVVRGQLPDNLGILDNIFDLPTNELARGLVAHSAGSDVRESWREGARVRR